MLLLQKLSEGEKGDGWVQFSECLSQEALEVSLTRATKEGSIEYTKRAICLQIYPILTLGIPRQKLAHF